jgi:methyl-accepting chemotaxis protein
LGIIPVVGVVLGLRAFDETLVHRASLDRAIQGAVHLQRINSLMVSIVMESRGIYTSSDTAAAEPPIRNLNRGLDELKETLRNWRDTSPDTQRTNVDELSRRIDAFIAFRTELLRLAREEGPTAARLFGDTDASRIARTALNENLQTMVRIYEQRSKRARADRGE